VVVGRYLIDDVPIRTQPLDCPVGAVPAPCPGTPGAGTGGYTYGDFGELHGAPKAHDDGEIWSQTLWDLRGAVGSTVARSLITRAMELSPANPSFLDMRNSILLADRVARDGRDARKIWKVFAGRGMGWFAADFGGDDADPIEDFATPPRRDASRTSVTGTVTDAGTGAPLAGVTVGFAGHTSGFAGSYRAVTDAQGRYTIANVLPGGTYPSVGASAAGYDPLLRDVRVRPGANRVDWALRRDWAAGGGGSTVTDVSGADYSGLGCGPGASVDTSRRTAWATDVTLDAGGRMEPRHIAVRLPAEVEVSAVEIDPTNRCLSAADTSAGEFRVETSPDGRTWTVAAEGRFGSADRNRMNSVPLTPGSTARVRHVRYTMLGTQAACPAEVAGCGIAETTEIGVYGTRTG
jgi:extracellular elastinolytic metalloproteinase